MKEENRLGGQSLRDDMSAHQDTALGVKKVAVYGDPTQKVKGIVYRRWVNKEGAEHNGWSYIGETPNEKIRQQSWNKDINSKYAGKKLVEARKLYPLQYWDYEVLEYVYASSHKELKQLLYERETYYIALYDSYANGFNSNQGGCGNKGVKFDESRCKQNGDNRRNKPQSDDTKRRISEKLKGRKCTKETRDKISEGNKGKRRSDAQRQAQSQRMKGKEPKAASEAARRWREENPGGYWSTHEINPDMRANMKAAQQKIGKRVKAITSDGTVICFSTMLDTAKYFKMGVGSISHFLISGNFSNVANARFEKITDEEYQKWKSDQS